MIAVVPGFAVGGGHSLHVTCDLTLASEEHAVFKQTDPDVASFDAGYGSALLARQVGQKRAREIFFLGFDYSADEAMAMGMVNASVPHTELEETALDWATTITAKSPTAQKMLKYAFNLPELDGVDPRLSAFITRMTARKPQQRFQSAVEALAALEAVDSGVVAPNAPRSVTGDESGMGGIALDLHRNKRSVRLDLKSAAGRDALLDLIDHSDVLVTNMRHAALARLGAPAPSRCSRTATRAIQCMAA